MTFASLSSYVVLAITAAVLFYAAIIDLREFKIPNELIIVLVCLLAVYSWLTGYWTQLHWNLAFAFFMLVVLLFFYTQKWLGGGDVKILTVAFLWVGIHCALTFAIFLAAFSFIYLIGAKLEWLRVQELKGRKRIPFAPSVAAALMATFMLGCLQPVQLASGTTNQSVLTMG